MKNRFNRADNSIHPFSIAFGKVSVYSEPTRLLLDGQDTVFIPYHSDEAPVRKYISSTASPDTVAFYHGAVNGAVMNSKAICHDSTISLPKLGKYKRVFLGHFHTHGPIGNPESTSMYVGAPIQSNMGDAGDLEHGFVSYRPRTDSWKLHRNPHAQYFVKIPWGEVEGQVREQVKGKKVRVELDGEVEVETRDINRVRETLYEYGADFVEVRSPQSSRKKQGPVPEVASTVKLGDTIAEMVESFIAASEATTEEDANHTLKQDRKAFFLEFVKPHQRPPPRAGTVFQGDLTTITMHNFRGIKDTTVFSLSDLPRAEVFVINGANGAGKSTLIEAIVWCLFGEFISGVPVEDISNRNALECYVQLDWGNGYKFKRSRKGKTKKAITFQITNPAGEVEEHGHNASTTTKWLQEQLLGMDIGMFKQTVVIGDDAAYLVRSAGERGRTECLDDMFGLEALGQIREALLLRVKVCFDIGLVNSEHGW